MTSKKLGPRSKRVEESVEAAIPSASAPIRRRAKSPEPQPLQNKEPASDGEPVPAVGEGDFFDSAFLDNLAHQLIAPLQCVENHCKNFLGGSIPESKIQTRFNEVVGHVRVMTALVGQMRHLHKLVGGGNAVSKLEVVPFEAVVTKMIDCYNNYQPLLKARRIEVDIDHPTMNTFSDVRIDHMAVHQIFMNLYDNISKYAIEGHRAEIFGSEQNGQIRVAFACFTQCPVKEEERETIFERGTRGNSAMALRATGTGVGLWVCRQLMRAMGGDIVCVPRAAKGRIEFRVTWRVAT